MKHIWTKMYPCTLNILKKQGVDKDPIYTLYDWLNYNMYSEENPPGATTTADFRNGMVIRYNEHQYEQKHRDNTISTDTISVKPLETLAQPQAY